MAFGYSLSKAEAVKDELDHALCQVENRIERLTSIVPDCSTVTARAESVVVQIQGMVGDLQAEVDRRTDRERS